MSTEPITCLGNDLAGVLSGIRERNCVPDRLECCVGGHNAQYRVSYFERGGVDSSTRKSHHVPKHDSGETITPSSESRVVGQLENVIGISNPTTLIPKPPTSNAPAQGSSCSSAALVVGEDSIEDLMAALQTKLQASGKLRRSKPTTKTQHARLPYPND